MLTFVKKIFDPLHGFISLTSIEEKLVGSTIFQRLRYIHQLGVGYLVYPGATHKRFEHSLGVMHLSSIIYDLVTSSSNASYIPEVGTVEHAYSKAIVRLAGLCHDLGHLPFSHTAEKRLLGKKGHELWTLQILQSPYLDETIHDLQKQFDLHLDEKTIREDLIRVTLGSEKAQELGLGPLSSWQKILSQMISGEVFGADRIDYLLRDSRFTGVAYGSFDYHQLIGCLKIVDVDGEGIFCIDHNGIESCEALLLARYFMHKRVYQHHAMKAYNFHMSRVMEYIAEKTQFLSTMNSFLEVAEYDVLHAMKELAKQDLSISLDAKIILQQAPRFVAYHIDNENLEERLHKVFGQDSTGFIWDRAESTVDTLKLSVPVIKANGKIVRGEEVSSIAVPIPSGSWVYCSNDRQEEMKRELGV